ncbi:hypothetical protein Tco_1377660 [Tanacetum coccineum]
MEECLRLLTDQVDLVNPKGHRLLPDVSKPLPLGGPPGQVTIQPQFFFNKDLEYLISGDTAIRVVLSISKLKVINYLDFRLEELVPSLWIESERDYNISAAYGITHWWFKIKEFYITRHNAPSDLYAVRSHMRILSVASLKKFKRYSYAFLKEIVIRRADYKEYKISEADFKNLHPNDFKDLYLLHLQGKLNHLPGSDKVHLYKALNWDASDFLFKEDYTIISKPRAVIYRDRNEVKKMMQINEVHKFSDGTLTRILDKLYHMVKDFRLFEYNRGMENRIWSEDDKMRREEFIKVIKRRLKIRRIFGNLKTFVGGREEERGFFFEKMGHRSGDFQEILNESTIEPDMTQKTSNPLDGGGMSILSKWERKEEKESPKTEKSSMKTSIVSSIMSWKMAIMHIWNVPGALHKPKGIRREENRSLFKYFSRRRRSPSGSQSASSIPGRNELTQKDTTLAISSQHEVHLPPTKRVERVGKSNKARSISKVWRWRIATHGNNYKNPKSLLEQNSHNLRQMTSLRCKVQLSSTVELNHKSARDSPQKGSPENQKNPRIGNIINDYKVDRKEKCSIFHENILGKKSDRIDKVQVSSQEKGKISNETFTNMFPVSSVEVLNETGNREEIELALCIHRSDGNQFLWCSKLKRGFAGLAPEVVFGCCMHIPKPKVTKEKPSKPSTAKPPKPKPSKEKSTKATPLQKAGIGEGEEYDVERAIQMSLESFQAQSQAHVGGVAIREPVAEATRPLPVVEGKGKAIDDTSANIVRDSPSPADAKTGADTDMTNSRGNTKILQIGDEQGGDVTEVVNLEDKTAEIEEGQAGSDPGKTPESRPLPDDNKMDEDQAGSDPGESRVALAGPNPEPMHDEFMANVYPKVHESLKFPADEHIILEDPLSSTRPLSSIKNLDDAFTIGDQFINDKATEDEPENLNVESEVVSMVNVLIYQASSSVLPLYTPVIDLSPPKPKFSDLEQKSKNLDNTTKNLGSRVFTLELRDLPYKIDEIVRETVKEAVQVALQAPLRVHFKDLPEADMKEMLHQRMFETGSYKSLPEHVALYEALEASMERVQRDEFLAEKDKSWKRRHDDQDPSSPPPKDLDQNKKKRHDSDASGSKQPPAPQS